MGVKKQASGDFSFQPFEDLKRIIESKGIKVSERPSVAEEKEQGEDCSDDELFRNAMKEVREIGEFRSIPVSRKRKYFFSRKESADREALLALEEIVKGKRQVNLSDTQEYVEFVNPDYSGDILRMLREGRFSVQDCLDLHGFIVEEAEEEVEGFLRESLRRRYHCVKIIHGRGLRSPKGPVLKEALVKWLSFRFRKNIVAFVTARQCDGGLGALYVLLK